MKLDPVMNDVCLHNPVKGDIWMERLTPICMVLDVTDDVIYYTDTLMTLDDEYQTFDTNDVKALSKEAWIKWLSYNHNDGTWADIWLQGSNNQ